MYQMNVHVMGLDELKRKLGHMAPDAKVIMKTALNETAKDTRRTLVNKARNTYIVKQGAFNKSMKLKRATNGSLVATLYSLGKPITLRGFAYRKHDVETAEPAMAHQIRGRRNKPLVRDDRKGFYAKMPNGHTGLFHRVNGSGKREKIREFYGSSIPVMLGGTRVYGDMEPEIQENLQGKLESYVDQMFRRF